ncbi:MAG: phosphoribosylglycinamide formyltransferase [Acidobacteriota bacterium]
MSDGPVHPKAATDPRGGRVPVGVLISGRGSNLAALLAACAKPDYPASVAVVLSNNKEAGGLARAREAGVATEVVDHREYPTRHEHERALVEILRRHGVEWVCLAGYQHLLRGAMLEHYRNRILNVHPALLPAFPGNHAQRQAVEYGARVSGCTVHFVDEGVDTGPIILQASVTVEPHDTEETLSERILREEHRLYPEVLRLAASGRLVIEKRKVRIVPETGRPDR